MTSSPDLTDWIGRTTEADDVVSPDRAQAMAATLDLDEQLSLGDALPAGWHWLFFNPLARRRDLGHDGHPKTGGFLPPVPLPRRMWASGQVRYLAPVRLGDVAHRRSEIAAVRSTTGRAGPLVFVTVSHLISVGGRPCIDEDQFLVYREATTSPSAVVDRPTETWPDAEWTTAITPDTTMLFRYSAVTSNGHRIHYDQTYARAEENYPDLVVHGPLTATLLQQFASRCWPDRQLIDFEFRATSPLFVDHEITFEGRPAEAADVLQLRAVDASGVTAMTASATFG